MVILCSQTTRLETAYSIDLLYSDRGFTWTRSYRLQWQAELEMPPGDRTIYQLMFGLVWGQDKQYRH